MKVSSGILNVFNKSLSWKAEKKELNTTTNSERHLFIQGWRKRGPTWNIVYIMTVSGRFPENSEILKTLRPHLFTCSNSFKSRKRNKIMKRHVSCQTAAFMCADWKEARQTFANSSSVSVLTPKRGMLELVRLEECWSFFTPLIWDMGLFFFSFSFCVWGHGISTSCCLSGVKKWSIFYRVDGVDGLRFWESR